MEERAVDKDKGGTTASQSSSTALETSLNMPANRKHRGSVSSASSSAAKTPATKRVSSTSVRKRKNATEANDLLSEMFGSKGFASLREREVKAREQEATARMIEAQASSAKVNKETELLSIDERIKKSDKRVKCMDETVKLLCERKRLLDENVCTEEELDKCLPLPK